MSKNNQQFNVSEVNSIRLSGSIGNVTVRKSDDESIKVQFESSKTFSYDVILKNKELFIKEKSTVISVLLFAHPHEITILVPESYTGIFIINATVGFVDVDVHNTFTDAAMCTTTGKLTLNGFSCKTLTASCTTGETKVTNIGVVEKANIIGTTCKTNVENINAKAINMKTSTGSIVLNRIESNDIYIKTSTGSVSGTLNHALIDYSISSQTSTGSNSLPESYHGGNRLLKVYCQTGSIRLTFAEKRR